MVKLESRRARKEEGKVKQLARSKMNQAEVESHRKNAYYPSTEELFTI